MPKKHAILSKNILIKKAKQSDNGILLTELLKYTFQQSHFKYSPLDYFSGKGWGSQTPSFRKITTHVKQLLQENELLINYKSSPKAMRFNCKYHNPGPQNTHCPAPTNYPEVSTSKGLILRSGNFLESKTMYFGGIIFMNGMENHIIFSQYQFLLTAELIF